MGILPFTANGSEITLKYINSELPTVKGFWIVLSNTEILMVIVLFVCFSYNYFYTELCSNNVN